MSEGSEITGARGTGGMGRTVPNTSEQKRTVPDNWILLDRTGHIGGGGTQARRYGGEDETKRNNSEQNGTGFERGRTGVEHFGTEWNRYWGYRHEPFDQAQVRGAEGETEERGRCFQLKKCFISLHVLHLSETCWNE